MKRKNYQEKKIIKYKYYFLFNEQSHHILLKKHTIQYYFLKNIHLDNKRYKINILYKSKSLKKRQINVYKITSLFFLPILRS